MLKCIQISKMHFRIKDNPRRCVWKKPLKCKIKLTHHLSLENLFQLHLPPFVGPTTSFSFSAMCLVQTKF
jgi:hypothetical protein